MPIIGTAGHVDHGKSTLVEALTGRDPDRWAEEKARGLTIDLGFAWTDIGDVQVGFVDVPGHERFIKNMLAGVGGVDVALFVVAADEGWMPQSEEHLAVLDILDVRHGVIALTKVDVADPDVADLAELEISEQVEGTSLEGWPVVRVAAPTGAGVAELRAALAGALTAAGPPPDAGRPRLWVDRAFVIAGAGTVVTGTLVGGRVRRGDELVAWPDAVPVRVRGLQTHEHDVEEVRPGSRAALNIAGAERAEIARGTMLGRADHFRATDVAVADLRAVRGMGAAVTARGAYQVHIGSASLPARLRLLETDNLESPGAAVLRLSTPIPLTQGDRIIVRETGRRAVVAGGVVLDPHPADLRAAKLADAVPLLRAALHRTPDERAAVLLDIRGIAAIDDLARDTGGGTVTTGIVAAGHAISRITGGATAQAIERLVRAFHDANPLRPGMPKAAIASQVGLPAALLDELLQASDTLVDDGSTVRAGDFGGGWGAAEDAAFERARALLRADGLAAPRASSLGLDQETMHAALRSGRLVRVGEDLVYLPEQIDEITSRLTELPEPFTVAQFRDAFSLTRRQAVPLLEWLDQAGWTVRSGDTRSLRPPPSRSAGGVPPP